MPWLFCRVIIKIPALIFFTGIPEENSEWLLKKITDLICTLKMCCNENRYWIIARNIELTKHPTEGRY